LPLYKRQIQENVYKRQIQENVCVCESFYIRVRIYETYTRDLALSNERIVSTYIRGKYKRMYCLCIRGKYKRMYIRGKYKNVLLLYKRQIQENVCVCESLYIRVRIYETYTRDLALSNERIVSPYIRGKYKRMYCLYIRGKYKRMYVCVRVSI